MTHHDQHHGTHVVGFARYVLIASPDVRAIVLHSLSSDTARMNSSLTRTEWLAFWKYTEE